MRIRIETKTRMTHGRASGGRTSGGCFARDAPHDYSNVRDLEGDRLVALQHRLYLPLAVVMAGLVPALLGLAWRDPLGGFLWAGCLRLVVQYHSTFAINSVAHRFGRRPYSHGDLRARQRASLPLLTHGRGLPQLSSLVSVRLPERHPVARLRPDEMARRRARARPPGLGSEARVARSDRARQAEPCNRH